MNNHTKGIILLPLALILLVTSSCKTIKYVDGQAVHSYEYYDQEFNKVSKGKFENIKDYAFNVDFYFVENSILKGYIVNRLREGQFISDQFESFKKHLQQSLETTIDFSRPVRISHYLKFDDFDPLIQIRDLEYTKEVDNYFAEFTNLHITAAKYPFDKDQYDAYEDRFDLIKRTFFKKFSLNSNNVIILPDGSYLSCIGDGCEYLGHELVEEKE